nr:Translocation protein SEC62 [Hymenolepis microstoma]
MDDKKRRKPKKGDTATNEMQPTSFELEVCKYMFRKLPTKDGRLAGCLVNYFKANEAIEFLLKSPWAIPSSGKKDSKSICLSNREVTIRFMEKLIEKRLIGRALKVKRKKKDDDKRTKTRKTNNSKEKSRKITTSLDGESGTSSELKNDTKSAASEGYFMSMFSSSPISKHRKPVRLEYAADQAFYVDNKPDESGAEDVYVWIYEAPPSLKTWLMGFALIVIVLLLCAHPLWPSSALQGLHYLFTVGLSFVGLIALLTLMRLFIFGAVFISSLGKLQVWVFPNLLADCGFFESFRPLYSLERAVPSSSVASPSSVVKSEDAKTDL